MELCVSLREKLPLSGSGSLYLKKKLSYQPTSHKMCM